MTPWKAFEELCVNIHKFIIMSLQNGALIGVNATLCDDFVLNSEVAS